MSERPTVVVTGLGAITPLGGDVASTWEGMLAGRSGVTRLDDEWAREFPAPDASGSRAPPAGPPHPQPEGVPRNGNH